MDNLRVHWSGVAKSDCSGLKFVNRVFALTLTLGVRLLSGVAEQPWGAMKEKKLSR
jgi:hypothetical protein